MTTLRGWLRWTDDAGIGVLGVIMFGATLSLVIVVVMNRGVAQFGNAAGDSCWEAALDGAESALSWGAAQVDSDPSFATDSYVAESYFGTTDERVAAVDAADLSAEVLQFSEAEGVFLRGAGSTVLYGVGFCDGRDDETRRVRVVRSVLEMSEILSEPWDASFAFLSGNDLSISGDPVFGDPEVFGNSAASAHANGNMHVGGNVTFWTGCVTSANGGAISGSDVKIYGFCPGPSERFAQPEEVIPNIVPEALWYLSEYDMCPGGSVRAGPAHPTLGASAGAAPCSGHVLVENASSAYRSFKHNGTNGGIAAWSRQGTKHDGSYYFHHGSVHMGGEAGTSTDLWQVLIIASAAGECANNQGGDITTAGKLRMGIYQPSTAVGHNNLLFVAGRDVNASGDGKILYEDAIIAAHEQISLSGGVSIQGWLIAEDACNTSGSPVSSSQVSGGAVIVTEGATATPLSVTTIVYGSLAGWAELR